jgi:type III pantothenate kinase
MLLVIDIGNTRTKWALADSDGNLSLMELCLNADISHARFPISEATKVVISNVAGEQIANRITQLLQPLAIHFVGTTTQACGIKNQYAAGLGSDRWAAAVAAWHHTKHATVVVNAGTAVTIDALEQNKKLVLSQDKKVFLSSDSNTKQGIFLGGTIMPGLHLMQQALSSNTAQLAVNQGLFADFPIDTADAIESGCLNAVAGAIYLMFKRLEKHSGWLPKWVISGGDAHKVAQALNHQDLKLGVKQVIIIENLVLQGLVLLGKE